MHWLLVIKYKMGKNHQNAYYRHLRHIRLFTDDYTCQNCGSKSFSNHAHHKSGQSGDTTGFTDFNTIKSDLELLMTLCPPCHRVVSKLYR